MEKSSVKVYLTFPKELVEQPLVYRMGKKFDVVTNIRGASISGEIGLVALEINGLRDEIDKAIKWLKDQGVQVEPIEKNVIE